MAERSRRRGRSGAGPNGAAQAGGPGSPVGAHESWKLGQPATHSKGGASNASTSPGSGSSNASANSHGARAAKSENGKGKGKRGPPGGEGKARGTTQPDKNFGKEKAQIAESEDRPKVDGSGPDRKDEDKRPSSVIFAQIRWLIDQNSALQQADFDFRIRQHFHAHFGQGGAAKVIEAARYLQAGTVKKERKAVKNWPAYLLALMRKFDQETAAKTRVEQANAKAIQAEKLGKVDVEGLFKDFCPQASAPSAAPTLDFQPVVATADRPPDFEPTIPGLEAGPPGFAAPDWQPNQLQALCPGLSGLSTLPTVQGRVHDARLQSSIHDYLPPPRLHSTPVHDYLPEHLPAGFMSAVPQHYTGYELLPEPRFCARERPRPPAVHELSPVPNHVAHAPQPCSPSQLLKLHGAHQYERQPEPGHRAAQIQKTLAEPSELPLNQSVHSGAISRTHPSGPPPSQPVPGAVPSGSLGRDLDPGSLDFSTADWLPWADETAEDASPSTPTRRFIRTGLDDGDTPPSLEEGGASKVPFGGFRRLGNAGSVGSKVAECVAR